MVAINLRHLMMNIFGSIDDLSFYGTRYDNFLLLRHLNIYRDDEC